MRREPYLEPDWLTDPTDHGYLVPDQLNVNNYKNLKEIKKMSEIPYNEKKLYCSKCLLIFSNDKNNSIFGNCPGCNKFSCEHVYANSIEEMSDIQRQCLHEDNYNIRCPHCLDETPDCNDLGDSESEVMECSNCGDDFIVTASIHITYSTKKYPIINKIENKEKR